MKQIMELFAKERSSRKKEMTKLKDQLQEKDDFIEKQKSAHQIEKNDLIQKWQKDSHKHQDFYEFMNKKVELQN